VVVIALTAEGISAALYATVGANRSATISAFSDGMVAARRTSVTVTGYVLDLTVHCSSSA